MIYLFGPPGVGKSTLVTLANSISIKSLDVEKLGNSHKERKEKFKKIIKNSLDYIIVGSADLSIGDLPNDAITVLLLPSFEVYAERLKNRDIKKPSKAGQLGLKKYKSFEKNKKKYNYVIDNSISVKETLRRILKLINIII